jgi:pimeloyl-ACP methyl ester carboxylesterase
LGLLKRRLEGASPAEQRVRAAGQLRDLRRLRSAEAVVLLVLPEDAHRRVRARRRGHGVLDRPWQDWCPGYDASEDLRNVKQCLGGAGNLTAAIGYYRAEEPGLRRGGADGGYTAEEAALARAGPQPTLYLHGNRDGCIGLALVGDAERHLATGSRMQVVDGAGHFPHVEKPTAVNDQILARVSQ